MMFDPADRTSRLPLGSYRGYTADKSDEEIAAAFERRTGRKPSRGWRFSHIVLIPLEGDECAPTSKK